MLVLQLVQLVVQAALCQQFLMGAFLPDLALMHDDDLVAVLDGGQAVCHDDGGTAFHQLAQCILNEGFGLGVDIGGSFVQNEHRRLEGQRAGKGQQLTLTGREGCAPLDDLMIIAALQIGDEGMGVDVLCRLHHSLVGNGGVVQPDIALDVTGEQEHILQHLTDVLPQVGDPDLPNVHAVDQNLTLLDVVIPADQVLDGGLTGTGGTNKGHTLTGLDLKGHVTQHPLAFTIGEPDVLELNMTLEGLHMDGILGIGDGGFGVHQPENTLGSRRGRLDHVEVFGHFLNGVEELGDVPLEGQQGTDAHHAGHSQRAAVGQQNGHGGNVQNVGDGAVDGMAHQLLDMCLAQLFALLLELPLGVLFGGEDLHHLHAGNVLGNESVQLGHLGADGTVHLTGDLGKDEGGDHRKGNDDENSQRQTHMAIQHGLHNAHQNENVGYHGDHHRGEHFQHGLTVVGDAGHQSADGVVVEEADVQLGQVVEDVGTHIVDDLLAHHSQQCGLRIGQGEGQRHRDQIQAAQLEHAHQVVVTHILQFCDGKALVGDADVLFHVFIGGALDQFGLPQLQPDGTDDNQQDQQEPADIGLAVFQKAADNVSVDHCVILFLAHNAYSSFFIFSRS